MASVVNVEESSYRRIGARMLVNSNGKWIGGISGGCLEGDALRRSRLAIYKNEPSTVIYDTMEDDNHQIGIGLGCNGKLEVLFTPIDHSDKNNPIEKLRAITLKNEPCILLKVIDVTSDASLLGVSKIAQPDLENLDFCDIDKNTLRSLVKETRLQRRPQIVKLKNNNEEQLKLLVEFIRPETKIIIIGDNYDVNALVDIATNLGWDIHLVGKLNKLSKSTFSKTKKVYDYNDYNQIPIDDYTAVVLMSHDYNLDKKILLKVLAQNPAYIGMLGPKKRKEKMKIELGIKDDLTSVSHFYSPIGLDIGAESPEEIALAIAAEIVACLRKRSGGFLKDRSGTIHERN